MAERAGLAAPGIPAAEAPVDAAEATAGASIALHLRGSSLLVSGRLLSLLINLVVQALIARHLTEDEFGAFAYALSLVVLGETVATLGLHRGVGRFLAVYDEQKDYDRVLGTLVLVLGTILGVGLAIALLALGVDSWFGGTVVSDGAARSLLAILIVLAPVQAADNVLSSALAVFGSPRTIFLRQHVLGPLLRLVVVVLLVLGDRDVTFLALGYMAAGVLGTAIYGKLVWDALGQAGVRSRLRLSSMKVPVRAVLLFTLPLLTTDLVYVSMNAVDVLVVGAVWGPDEVGDLRIIQPLANLNALVLTSYTVLYMPVASRLHSRGDLSGVRDLYWRTAAWVAVLSFPLFGLTAFAARPLTTALFGERYAGSAGVLTALAIGLYVNAAFGFNGLTLRVFGAVWYVVAVNVTAALVSVGLTLWLVPELGALGAALATMTTLLLHNLLKQLGLLRTGIPVFDRRFARVYACLFAATALLAASTTLHLGLLSSVGLVGLTSLCVLTACRGALDVLGTFPFLARWPAAARLFRG